MTDKEVMQMALQKMEYMLRNGEWYEPEKAIEALRAALAQPEKTDMQIGLTYEEANPPQREWVGLTDDEYIQLLNKAEKDAPKTGSVFKNLWYAINTKLKEKNNDK